MVLSTVFPVVPSAVWAKAGAAIIMAIADMAVSIWYFIFLSLLTWFSDLRIGSGCLIVDFIVDFLNHFIDTVTDTVPAVEIASIQDQDPKDRNQNQNDNNKNSSVAHLVSSIHASLHGFAGI